MRVVGTLLSIDSPADGNETEQRMRYKLEDEESLKARIGQLAFDITQRAATEPPFTGEYDTHFERGIYVDVVSGEPLFASSDKFDSGCGWPAFAKPISAETLTEHTDNKLWIPRVEVRSAGSRSHLGHVFGDGPKELGGKRYCINSAALRFVPYDEMEEQGYGEWMDAVGE